MLCQVWSATTVGIDAVPVQIETNIIHGIPRYTVVGLPDVSVRESRDRIQAAITNSDFEFPRGCITVNLAPADIRKEGSAFDLPIAVSLLGASGQFVDYSRVRRTLILGELALNGQVRPVRGVLPVAMRAREDAIQAVVVPEANAAEAALVDGLKVFGVRTLSDTFAYVTRSHSGPRCFQRSSDEDFVPRRNNALDYADVRGQEGAKRALEVAAAGGHNVLMVGVPGAGKTMLARRLPTILPLMDRYEALETTKVHSVGGRINGSGLIRTRPFRSPHHTISVAGLCGGGASPRPGEISLAHHGVLFLDELPEFRRAVLEVLRQPLEEGHITITRASAVVDYPANFMLVASMNPCPCGYLSDPGHACVCSPSMIHRYHGRISGPLLDRIDLHLSVNRVGVEDLSTPRPVVSSEEMRDRVQAARAKQSRRLGDAPVSQCNARMSVRQVRKWCRLEPEAAALLKEATQRLRLSARGFERIVRVARTIADLEVADHARLRSEHIAEAIQYRSLDRLDVLRG